MEVDEILNELIAIVKDTKDFPNINRVILFGSFVKNKQGKSSDIDVAIDGDFDYFRLVDRIKNEINTLRTFDVVEYNNIASESFKREIDEYGRVLYKV